MKKAFYIITLFWLSALSVNADSEIKIKLDNDEHPDTIVQLDYCNIFLELKTNDDDSLFYISIRMENISEDKTLFLFNKSYDEKTLKDLDMSVKYDKVFQGPKGGRVIDPCVGLRESLKIPPSSDAYIVNLQGDSNTLKYKLPIYIARKKKKDFYLAQKDVTVLNIEVETKPDEEFINLSDSINLLLEEIEKQTFCSNKNHKGTPVKKLYNKYNTAKDNLKDKIQGIISSRGYEPTDKGFKQFKLLTARLDSIDLEDITVPKCGNDKKPVPPPIPRPASHSCKYCSWSLEKIYKKMEGYYIDLHNRKKTKGQISRDVDTLYKCATKNKKRSGGSAYMSRISTYYNKINSK